MTKILNLALKIKGDGSKGGTCEVLRPCHPLPPPQNLERALLLDSRGIYRIAMTRSLLERKFL